MAVLESCWKIPSLLGLKRSGCTVSTFKSGDKEVDFISEKDKGSRYYQATWKTGDYESRTYKREFGNLTRIKDYFPKIVISMDTLTRSPEQGVKHIYAMEFFS